jgi:hypothetical protein
VRKFQSIRLISNFAHVKPGPVSILKHVAQWSENEGKEVWKHEGIPVLDEGLPEEARGQIENYFQQEVVKIHNRFASLYEASPQTFLVASLKEVLGSAELSDAEWATYLSVPTETELNKLKSESGIRAEIEKIYSSIEELQKIGIRLEQDHLDSGLLDFSLPIPQEKRQRLQSIVSRPFLVQLLQLTRSMSILTHVIEASFSSEMKSALQTAIERLSLSTSNVSTLGGAPVSADGESIPVHPFDTPVNEAELDTINMAESYDRMKQSFQVNKHHLTAIPAVSLPVPLHQNAPTKQLEDAARLIDENPTHSDQDKLVILKYYADALKGKASAFDFSKEKAAYVDPQPQYAGVYDPQEVVLQDTSYDAIEGTGKFSKKYGSIYELDKVPPSSIGNIDLNPTRSSLTAKEEVANVMEAYKVQAQSSLEEAEAAITSTLELMMGVRLPRASGSKEARESNKAAQEAQVAKARAKLLFENDTKSFFEKYAKGEDVGIIEPAPPASGNRRKREYVELAAAPVDDKAKGAKGKGKK